MKKTYVIHCDKCNRLVDKDEKEIVGCPPEKTGPLPFECGAKFQEIQPYTKQFDGRHYYPNVNRHFNSHREYENFLKATGREIVTDHKHDEDIGSSLRPNEGRKRGKTLYFT